MLPADIADKADRRLGIGNRVSVDVFRAAAVGDQCCGESVLNQIDGERLPESRPATVLGKYAAGVCWKEKLAMIQADSKLRSIQTKIDVLQATLNAKQSINRHLSHV